MDVMNLARDVIRYSDRHGKLVSNLKLQKTLYYIQGYCLKFFSRKAFDNAIVHWAYGPVVLDAYYGYSIFRDGAYYSQPGSAGDCHSD